METKQEELGQVEKFTRIFIKIRDVRAAAKAEFDKEDKRLTVVSKPVIGLATGRQCTLLLKKKIYMSSWKSDLTKPQYENT